MLKEVVVSTDRRYSFTTCNPPFFGSEGERLGGGLSRPHRPAPPTFSRGAKKEMVTEGGEVEFIRRIVVDSIELKDRVR